MVPSNPNATEKNSSPCPSSTKEIPSANHTIPDHHQFYQILHTSEIRESASYDSPRIAESAIKSPGEIIETSQRIELNGTAFVRLAYVDGWIPEVDKKNRIMIKLLDESRRPIEETGSFYYKVIIPINVRMYPETLSPILQEKKQNKQKNAEEIVECCKRYTLPGSNLTYVKLAYEDGWLFESLPTGTKVLEILTKSPDIIEGQFFYLVRIPVGVRVAPNIMARRAGKGYRLHTIVEGTQRFTPPGSSITYVKLINDEGWVFETTMDKQTVLELLPNPSKREISRAFYKLLVDVPIVTAPDLKSEVIKTRKSGTVIECNEILVPHGSNITFLKLRHDDGWAYETNSEGVLMVERMEGGAKTLEGSKFYEVKNAVGVRSAPDTECARIPGVQPKTVGTVLESSHRYTPPGSSVTYVKLAHEHGWVMESTPDGLTVLEELSTDPDRKQGRFFYRALKRLPVRASPEENGTIMKYIENQSMFPVDLQFSLPKNKDVTYLRLLGENLWISREGPDGVVRVQAIPEDIYNLYHTPPKWVALGSPSKTWFKVPEEYGKAALADETLLQIEIFQVRNVLATSSRGTDMFPLSRQGVLCFEEEVPVTIEEIKHPASSLFFTFPWKQIWWSFDFNGNHHAIEVQHGLRGGYRSIRYNGEVIEKTRPMSGIIWDTGSSHEFERCNIAFRVSITLEGSFFSSYMQFYSYQLQVNGQSILQNSLLGPITPKPNPPAIPLIPSSSPTSSLTPVVSSPNPSNPE